MTAPLPSSAIDSNPPSVLNHRLAAEDVVVLYQAMLGRLPEDEGVIEDHLRPEMTIREFVVAVTASPEFRAAMQDLVHRIDVDASAEQIERILDHQRDVWARYGETDPFWSVLTHDAFRGNRLDDALLERFYSTGAADAVLLSTLAERHDLTVPADGRVLDFGCGVGRVGEHLSAMFASYDGVDLSGSHLKLAADRFAARGIENASFRLLPDFLAGNESFDVVYSVLVLQHNPPPLMRHLLRRMLDSLRDGGVGLFQLPCAIASFEFNLDEYLAAPPPNQMGMYALPCHVVEQVISEAGCSIVEAFDDGYVTPRARSMTFCVQRR